MKKMFLAGILFLTGLTATNAQQYRTCDTDAMMQNALLNDPNYAINRAELEQFTAQYILQQQQDQSLLKTSGVILYTIPVVFHVVHNYGYENISKAQIVDAMEIFNKSFQNLWGDSMTVCSIFRPIIADAQIQFRLAQIDENGNCTDGITRTVSNFTYSANDNVKTLVQWPSNKYFNGQLVCFDGLFAVPLAQIG